MKLKLILYLALILSGLTGCRTASDNLRSKMERAAAIALPDGVQQTEFAYVGDVQTDNGVYHVTVQRRILTGMMAPRGEPIRLLLFSNDARLVAVYQADFATRALPLWCEGSRIYLNGFSAFHFADSINHQIPPGSRLAQLFSKTGQTPSGNVIDFSCGPLNPFLNREKRYGSSGGIEDNPWSLKP